MGHVLILSHRTLPDAPGLRVKAGGWSDGAAPPVQPPPPKHSGQGCCVRDSLKPQGALTALQGCPPRAVRVGVACGHLSALRYSGVVVRTTNFAIRAELLSFPLCAGCVNSGKLLNLSGR